MPNELPFALINLKSPSGISPPFPSRITSMQAAREFVDTYVDAPRRNTLRWHLAITALNAGEGSCANAELVMRNALYEEGWIDD